MTQRGFEIHCFISWARSMCERRPNASWPSASTFTYIRKRMAELHCEDQLADIKEILDTELARGML